MSIGNITVGVGTPQQRDLEVVNFVQAQFADNRLITISEIEDGSITATVENPISTGRNPQATIWLTKESFIGVLSTAVLYFSSKGEDLGELMKQVVEKDEIDYKFSKNLNPFNS